MPDRAERAERADRMERAERAGVTGTTDDPAGDDTADCERASEPRGDEAADMGAGALECFAPTTVTSRFWPAPRYHDTE